MKKISLFLRKSPYLKGLHYDHCCSILPRQNFYFQYFPRYRRFCVLFERWFLINFSIFVAVKIQSWRNPEYWIFWIAKKKMTPFCFKGSEIHFFKLFFFPFNISETLYNYLFNTFRWSLLRGPTFFQWMFLILFPTSFEGMLMCRRNAFQFAHLSLILIISGSIQYFDRAVGWKEQPSGTHLKQCSPSKYIKLAHNLLKKK